VIYSWNQITELSSKMYYLNNTIWIYKSNRQTDRKDQNCQQWNWSIESAMTWLNRKQVVEILRLVGY